ncbi:hypothetical conserved protein [Rhizobium etli CIAT 652]|uniref:Hypothetical conserved protein n=1 Tax=Rhizobium etli (strain CIAT 652) TaxID=491916 RepID=B3PXV6_RHIE6|nr:hypothetical conserved protein [Rhizobium etli CIAT 652]
MQFAVGHAAEFGDRLTILAPVVERASDVHVKSLSEGLICQQPPIGADLYLMTGIYVAVRRRKTAKFSGHLCGICNALHNVTAVWPTNRQSDLREYSTFEAARGCDEEIPQPLAGYALDSRFVAGSTSCQSLRWPRKAARSRMRRCGLGRRKLRLGLAFPVARRSPPRLC